MINLEKKYLNLVQTSLKKHIPNDTVWLFGSRATTKIKPYSDIDLVIISNKGIPSEIMCALSREFAESDLPYKVDLVEWSMLSKEFKMLIQNRHEIIQQGKVK